MFDTYAGTYGGAPGGFSGGEAAVFVFDGITVPVGSTLRGQGTRSLVLISMSGIDIKGTIDVSSEDAQSQQPGPFSGGPGGGDGGVGGAGGFGNPGIGLGTPGAGCEHKDFDLDGDVDTSDFAVPQKCFSGQNNPAAPTCGD